MPDFTIEGNPAAIRARAATARSKGESFTSTGDALARVTTEGWTGRAADAFREAFDTEPERWRAAGDGFVVAAGALEAYADAVASAQKRAEWASAEYARGDQVSAESRAAWEADVARGRQEVADAASRGVLMTLTIIPFDDPGQAIRNGALSEYGAAKADLASAAQLCADGVRAGCAAAPAERNWFESGLKFVGGIFEGAGEAVWDLVTISPVGPVNMINDAWSLATGDLTPEELAAKYRMSLEAAGDMLQALKGDPVEFGKQLGKGLLDWDTWSDDPARAIGHLVPDAVAAVLTAGTGVVATRGVKGSADAIDALSDLSRLDNAADLNKLDALGDLNRVDLDSVPDWADGRPMPTSGAGADLYPDDLRRYGDLDRQQFYDRYWDPDRGSWNYPDADAGYPDGFDGPVAPNQLGEGDVIDRFGRPGGEYASPAGTPFPDRALPPSSIGAGYHQYEVLRPLPEGVTEGRIAPWFEQPGGGVQYKFDRSIEWYETNGYLRKIGD